MSKKASLQNAMQVAVTAKKQAAQQQPDSLGKEVYSASAVNLRKGDWKLLRRVAEARAELHGGRPSVSKVIEGLIDAARKGLEGEL